MGSTAAVLKKSTAQEQAWSLTGRNWLGLITGGLQKGSDAILALGVLVMIAIMILPVPPWLLDLFLTLNLAGGAVLLMSSVLTPSGVKIFTFPTMLILTTLFRLALDVSSTRLILSEGEAGQVIRSFGQFAAGGSVVVGLVVFLIITLVQLIVISKGAEQTAIAVANFVRESIGGRQMALTSDINEGRISGEEVAIARRTMTLEVDFYGRMYGAMQFIKGDSIAGLVVAAINIVGGLIVGVAVNHMALRDAVETYTLLTVGAGLVSQIPALVGSVAGTILISRVGADNSVDGLGETAAGQFKALPKAMMLAAVMLFVLGLVPGMPTIPFLALAGALGYGGYRLNEREKTDRKPTSEESTAGVAPQFAPAAQVEALYAPDRTAAEVQEIRVGAKLIQDNFGRDSGIPLPAWSFRTAPELKTGGLAIRRGGVEIAADDSWEKVRESVVTDLRLNPAKYFGPYEANLWFLAARKAHPYLGDQLVNRLNAQTAAPPEPERLYRFLRLLVEERIPISHSWTILNALLVEKDVFINVEQQRLQLAKTVRLHLVRNSARYIMRNYWEPGSSVCFAVGEKSELRAALGDGSADGLKETRRIIQENLPMAKRPGTSIFVEKDKRRALWSVCEQLYQDEMLHRPAIVLFPEEMKAPEFKNLEPTEI